MSATVTAFPQTQAARERLRLADAKRKLSIADYADYELLHVVQDHEGDTTAALAEFLEAEPRSVGSRLSWMRRKALVDRDAKGGWVLARNGKNLLRTRGAHIMAVRKLSRQASADRVAGWVAHREWLRNR